jgi:hypothetical protein
MSSIKKTEGNIAFSFSLISVSFDPLAFDAALRSHGVKFIHWRAMGCPVGMTDQYSTRQTHEDHSGCANGHIYTRAGSVTGIFTGNDAKSSQNEIGLLDGSSVQVTLPRTYDDSDEEVMVAPFDRFYLAEEAITVPHKQFVEASITGKDRLSFPAVRILDTIDSHGTRYGADDFSVDGNGQIVWKGGGPGYDAELKKGTVYSIRFTYRPYWYCSRVIHQVRVAKVDTGTERKVTRMPQSFVLQREYVFEGKEEKDEQAPNPDSPRQAKAPRQGVFSPR